MSRTRRLSGGPLHRRSNPPACVPPDLLAGDSGNYGSPNCLRRQSQTVHPTFAAGILRPADSGKPGACRGGHNPASGVRYMAQSRLLIWTAHLRATCRAGIVIQQPCNQGKHLCWAAWPCCPMRQRRGLRSTRGARQMPPLMPLQANVPNCDRGSTSRPMSFRGTAQACPLKFGWPITILFSLRQSRPSRAACFCLFASSLAGEWERVCPFASLLRQRRIRP